MLYQTKNPHGGDIYAEEVLLDFSANTNPLGTPREVLEAITAALPQLHRYPDPYCRELVRAIGDFEGVAGQHILCGNGAAELIYAYCQALRPRLAVELAPTFSEYTLALRRVGCRVRRYPLARERDFLPDRDLLPFLEAVRPEAVFLCNPNNPTGQIFPRELLLEVLALCRKEDIQLFVDECFLDLSDDGKSLKPFLEEETNLFLLKAFTKSYGMAGIRLGYGLSGNRALLEEMSRAVQPWNVSTLAQAAGVAALGAEDFLAKTRALIPAERQFLTESLERLGFWVCPSSANFLLFHGPENLDFLLKRRKIAIRNCDNYQGLGPGWYRIAVRSHRENQALIQALREV